MKSGMKSKLQQLIAQYEQLGIDQQINYDKFYLYSLITHSTAIEGSTITEVENQIMFDHGVSIKGKSLEEQSMNLDLKVAYEKAIEYARYHTPITNELLINLSALMMKNTGKEYKTALGDFSSARGEIRLLNVTAGFGGRSYMSYSKVPAKLEEFCRKLNTLRQQAAKLSIDELYNLTFDAHYNLVTIHPWADGNGRMARLWHTAILTAWKPIFEFIPIESQIEKFQDGYYEAISKCHKNGNSNVFIEFMLEQIDKVLDETLGQIKQNTEMLSGYVIKMLDVMEYDIPYSANEIMAKLGLKSKETFRKNYMNPALEQGIVKMTIPDKPNSKNQRYIKV